jgi:dUTP pyrophosphatase
MNLNPNITYYSEISPIGKPMLDMLGITYADSCIETLQWLSYEGDASFTLLTGIKYLWRVGQKTEDISGDLIKAIDYFTWSLQDNLHPLPKRWVEPIYSIIEECQALLENSREKGEISIIKLSEVAQVPVYAHEGDSGADLRSIVRTEIPAGSWGKVPTGLAINLPVGTEAQVRSRSGLAARYGISVLNSPGTIDSSYNGEISVILINHSLVDFSINIGDKIAQLVICPVFNNVKMAVVDKITKETSRGSGGFGSTGIFADEEKPAT